MPPLGVAVFGVSTPFAYWGFNLVREIVAAVAGPTRLLHTHSLARLREDFARRDGASVVMASDYPDADLAAFLAGSGLPVILFADAPDVMLDWAMASREMAPAEAARLCSRVCSALAPALKAERLLILSAQVGREALVAEIAEHLWPGLGLRADPAAFGEFGDPAGPVPRPEAETDLGRALKRGLAAYTELARGRPPDEIAWPLPLFTRPDGRPWGEPLLLAGPARALMYGPYMHLPAGDWSARVEFEVAGVFSGADTTADVRITEVVARSSVALPPQGIYAYDLPFRVRDPHEPVEIRLFLSKGAIEGAFLPRSVTVRPQRVAAPRKALSSAPR